MSKLSTLKQEAYQAGKKRNWDEAAGIYERILTIDKNNPTLINELGDIYLKTGDVARSLEHFLAAASKYRTTGLQNNAVAIYKKILRHDSGNLNAHWYLAEIRAGQGLGVEGELHALAFLTAAESISSEVKEIFLKRCVKLLAHYSTSVAVLEKLTDIFHCWSMPLEKSRAECLLARRRHEAGHREEAAAVMAAILANCPEIVNYPEYSSWQNGKRAARVDHPATADVNTIDLSADTPADLETVAVVPAARAETSETVAEERGAPPGSAIVEEGPLDIPEVMLADIPAEEVPPENRPAPDDLTAGDTITAVDPLQVPAVTVEEWTSEPAASRADSPADSPPPALSIPPVDSSFADLVDPFSPEADVEAPEISAAADPADMVTAGPAAEQQSESDDYDLADEQQEQGCYAIAIDDDDDALMDVQDEKDEEGCFAIDPDGDVSFDELLGQASSTLTVDVPVIPDARAEDGPGGAADGALPQQAESWPAAPAAGHAGQEQSGSFDLLDAILADGDTDLAAEAAQQVDTIAAEIGQLVGGPEASDDPARQYEMGMVYLEMDLHEQACVCFAAAVRDSEHALRAYEMWGIALRRCGKPEKSVEVLSLGLELPTENPRKQLGLFYHLGRAYEDAGHIAEAREYYKIVQNISEGFQDVQRRLAELPRS